MVEKEEVVIERGLIVKASHNSVTPASEISHNLVIIHLLPEELEEHADCESELLLGRVEDRGWSSTMLSSDDHIQKVLDTDSEHKVNVEMVRIGKCLPEYFSTPTVE